MPASPVLDLGSLNPERPFITIDGQSYRMKVSMDIDLVTLAKLTAIDQRLEPKSRKVKPTLADATEFSRAIDDGVRHIMYDAIPDDVMGQLNEVAKLAILDAFPLATPRTGLRPNRKVRRAMARSTSRGSSRA